MSLVVTSQNIFNQLSELLTRLSDTDYSRTLPILNGSSIGQHVRHTLEFYTCLFEGIPNGTVDYDSRRRDIFLESNTSQAQNCLDRISNFLKNVEDNIDLELIQSYGEGEDTRVPTNLNRELIYNIEHAVHHMALIRVGLMEIDSEMELDKGFGVASSTLKYRKELQLSK
ncbi:DinB family protein [Reichenbachiella versicolor]|uniref:DinB family protein n=1 Tax=Reichenbachiella versicolor TaxID=1821036 RepID=UPI000D6E4BBA|nr:DinB family protein [Reichenbachiella versicolor]